MRLSNESGAKRWIIVAANLVGLAFCAVAQAEDSTTIENLPEIVQDQRELLDSQQELLEQLQGRLDRLESQGEQRIEGVEEDEEHLGEEVAETRAEVREALEEVEAIDMSIETDRMDSHQGQHLEIKKTGTKLTISGYVKGDVIHDFREMNSPAKFVATNIVIPEGRGNQTTFSANASRFLIATATPTPVGKLTTLVSMDFFGNTTSAKPDPRLRQAWGQLDDFVPWVGGSLRVGQSWSSWDDIPSLPETLDFEGPNASDQTRHMLVRYERKFGEDLVFWLALENPSSSIEAGAASVGVVSSQTRSPDGVLSLRYDLGDWGYVKPAVLFRDVSASDSVGPGAVTQHKFGWAINVSSTTNLLFLGSFGKKEEKQDNLRWEINYGHGWGSYTSDGVSDGVIVGNDLQLLPVLGVTIGYQHFWLQKLRSNAVFGMTDVNNRATQAADALDRTLYTALNLIWSPVSQVDLGMEGLWGQRRNLDGEKAWVPRLQFSAKFKY